MTRTAYTLLVAAWLIAVFVLDYLDTVLPPSKSSMPYNEYMQKAATWIEPGSAEARALCPNPGGPFLRGTGACVRIPTFAKPYCPAPGY